MATKPAEDFLWKCATSLPRESSKFKLRSTDDSSSASFSEHGDIAQAVAELTLLLSDELGERPKPRVSNASPVPSAPAIVPHFLFRAFVLVNEKLEYDVESSVVPLC